MAAARFHMFVPYDLVTMVERNNNNGVKRLIVIWLYHIPYNDTSMNIPRWAVWEFFSKIKCTMGFLPYADDLNKIIFFLKQLNMTYFHAKNNCT